MSDQTTQFQDIIKNSVSDKQPLSIIGGNTKSFLGRETKPRNNILKTTSHKGILSYEPVELIMQARSGTSITEIEEALAEKGQCLPSEPAMFNGKATIGGSLAANISGPARPWSGSLRDHILGVSLINGEGTHMHFGGQVIKNVAGYDVSRLQTGSMGTLGVVTDVSFKVMPKWKFERSYEYECDPTEALILSNQYARSVRPLLSASYFDGHLITRFATMENAIENSVGTVKGSELTSQTAISHWQNVREFTHPFFSLSDSEEIWRISVKSNAPYPKEITGEWAFDWGGALRWLKTAHLNHDSFQAWARRHGASYLHWSGGDKTATQTAPMPEALKNIHRNVKKAFDPHHIFNPGRLYEWM